MKTTLLTFLQLFFYSALAAVFLLPGQLSAQCTPPTVNFTDTITICQGNFITLNATSTDNPQYLWSTGDTTSSLTISTSGSYWVQVTNNCGNATDTVQIEVDPLVLPQLGSDREFCLSSGDSLKLLDDDNTSYLWQDGSTTSSFYVSQSGTYHVEVTNACGTFRDTVNLTGVNPPNVNLGSDIFNCSGDPDTLQISVAPSDSVYWSDGSNGSFLVADSAGTYWVWVNNACGVFSDTIEIAYNQVQGIEIGDTLYKCPGDTLILNAGVSGGTYSWSNGSSQSFALAYQPGLYSLTFSNACGSFRDSVIVLEKTIQVDLGPDTTVCDFLLLSAGKDAQSIIWSTGTIDDRVIAVRDTGTYWVGVSVGCGYQYDTIQVNVKLSPNPGDFIKDTVVICPGDSVRLDAGVWGQFTTYKWSDGSSGRFKWFSNSGSEWVEVSNDCDTVRKNFYIKPLSNNENLLPADTLACAGAITLASNKNFSNAVYIWSNGGTGIRERIASSGIYWLQVFTPCDTLSDTIQVTLSPTPAMLEADTLKFCSNSSLTIKPEFRENAVYNWNTGSSADSIVVNAPGKYWYTAYGACDTVSDTVYAVQDFPLNVDLGVDTSFCEPNFFLLDYGNIAADSVYWNTGSNDTAIVIDSTGTYFVELFNTCGRFVDTIQVTVDLLPDKVLEDTSFCYNSAVNVSAAQPQNKSYLWSTGATTSTISINQAGYYFVDMTSDCGTVRDSFYVGRDTLIAPFSLGPDTVVCAPLQLDPGPVGGTDYLWQDSIPGRQFTAFTSGTYWVTARNACNSYTDTIDVIVTGPPLLVLGDEVRFCEGTTLTLNAQNPFLGKFLWNTGDTTQLLSVDSAGTYWVTITNNCGQKTDTVEVIVETPMTGLDLGKDTIFCAGDSLLLTSQYPQYEAQWSTGETSQFIYADTTGYYWVKKSNSCGNFSDTIFVEVQEAPVFSLGKDSAYCYEGQPYLLEGPPGMNSYLWNTGETTPSILVQDSTRSYSLTVTNDCFSYTDEVFLDPQHRISLELGPDTTLCFGESLFLEPGSPRYGLIWSDNTEDTIKEITRPGTYWVFSANECDFYHDTIVVNMDLPLDTSPLDTSLCEGDSLRFDFRELAQRVEWDGEAAPLDTALLQAGQYRYTAYNRCGSFTREVTLREQDCECPFFIPDAFTPNGDGLNDRFAPVHDCDLTYYHLSIFSKTGALLYETHDPQAGWNGKLDGEEVPGHVMIYKVEYRWRAYNIIRERSREGVLTLVR